MRDCGLELWPGDEACLGSGSTELGTQGWLRLGEGKAKAVMYH